jgi:Fe-S-cluster containining protein
VSQDERRARRAGKVVLQLYREHAPYVAQAAERMGVTCKEGCSHCCKLPATATVPEMVLVVDYLTKRCDWPKRKPLLERELARQLTEFAAVDVLDEKARIAFFRRQLPCAFLKDDRCEIYEVRPTVCRYHMVVSSPDNCVHGPKAKPIALVDLRKIEHGIAIKSAEAFGELTGGPIALAFVLAADLLDVRLDIDRTLLKNVTNVHIKVRRLS